MTNDQAIVEKIWAPGIDDGYVPQGLAFANGAVFVSGYKSTDPKVGKGECRVFKVDVKTGEVLDQFKVSDDCGHAGGLTFLGDGQLVVSDTRRLFRIDLTTKQEGPDVATCIGNATKLGADLQEDFRAGKFDLAARLSSAMQLKDDIKAQRKKAKSAETGSNYEITGVVKLGGGVKGSFIDFDGKSIFLGASEKDPAKAKGFFPANLHFRFV